MADFCQQCARELGLPTEDMRGLVPEGMSAMALCEDCGPTYVDAEGRCVGRCLKDHGKALDLDGSF